MKNKMVQLTGISSPVARKNGYTDIVGEILPVTGNAYYGFKVHLPSGESRHLNHYFYKFI